MADRSIIRDIWPSRSFRRSRALELPREACLHTTEPNLTLPCLRGGVIGESRGHSPRSRAREVSHGPGAPVGALATVKEIKTSVSVDWLCRVEHHDKQQPKHGRRV